MDVSFNQASRQDSRTMSSDSKRFWKVPFVDTSRVLKAERGALAGRWALVVLNQPFSMELFDLVWHACESTLLPVCFHAKFHRSLASVCGWRLQSSFRLAGA